MWRNCKVWVQRVPRPGSLGLPRWPALAGKVLAQLVFQGLHPGFQTQHRGLQSDEVGLTFHHQRARHDRRHHEETSEDEEEDCAERSMTRVKTTVRTLTV